jgi:HK97 family phage portal protein
MGIIDTLFRRKKAETRAVDETPSIMHLMGGISGGKQVAVSPRRAVSLGVVFECVDVICRTLTLVSPKVYREKGNLKEIDSKNPLYTIVNSNPYTLYSSLEFYSRIIRHYLLFGNAYIEIKRNGGKVSGLKIHEPDCIDVEILDIDGIESHWYRITNKSNANDNGRVIPSDDMIHIMDYNLDGVKGLSRINLKANSLKNAGNIQNYASDMYANGANISGYIYGDRAVQKEALDHLRQQFEQNYTTKNGGIAALPLGFKYEPLKYNIPFADAQIIEGSKFAVEDVARMFGVPLTLLDRGESADNKGDREFNTFLTTTIAPLCRMIEAEFNRKLFTDSAVYMKFELKGLYRVDMEARYRAHQIALNAGFMNKDEVRRVEDMNPVPEGLGEIFYQPLNTIPLEKAMEYFDNVINSGKSKELNNDNTGV